MQENHSFDNYFGMLPLRGQPAADGFTFDGNGVPTNSNPLGSARMVAFHEPDFAGVVDTGSQSWNDTHRQIDGGAMDGFAETGPGSMGYWDEPDLPFYYSLAKTFTLANRWFCSAPCQTYPNRRFLMAGTASGVISTSTSNIDKYYPANGTIFDLLCKHNISWRNYFSDAPSSAIILETALKHPANLARIEEFYLDAALGALPAVSLVDCNFGAITGENSSAWRRRSRYRPSPTCSATCSRPPPSPRRTRRTSSWASRSSPGSSTRCSRSGLAEDDAGLALRRTRWVLRPRATADSDRTRLDPADARPWRRPR